LDDNATVDKERMKQIAKLLLHNNIKIKLWCLWSIKNFDQEMMEIMYQAGFWRIHYGVETGDETIARKINKPLTQKEILSTIRKTKNIGFRIRTSWILDLDPATLKKTLDLIKKTQTDEIRLHFLALRYGSEIYVSNDKNITSQYIHQGKSTQNTLWFKKEIDQLLAFLQKHWYNIRPQNKDNTSLLAGEKYVSLCPLKYGINW
jgi:radical SAM superfamily enzyme YgiQ (UPF0313 family)